MPSSLVAAATMSRLHRLLAPLAVMASAGCTGSDPAASYERMPRLALTPGVTFCAEHDAEGCEFVDITVAAVGPDGRVALAGAYGEAVQFDATGRFVRRLGRVGSGPGEYRSNMAVTYDSAATFTVFDVVTGRLVSLDSAGRPAAVSRVELPPATQHAGFADGRLVFAVLPGAAAFGDTVEAYFVAMDGAAAAPTLVLGRTPAAAIAQGDGSLMPISAPFAPRGQWGISRGGALFHADGAALRVVRVDGTAPRAIVDVAVTPPAVTAAELDSVRELMSRPVRGPGATTAMQRQLMQSLQQQKGAAMENAATVHPMVGALAAMDDGTFWARETFAGAPDSLRWNGFDGEGRMLGHILLPVGARILAGDRGRLLVATRDADDVPRATWYTLGGG